MEMYACAWTWRNSQTVKRKHYMLPNLDDIAPKLRKATAFSKLDASSGFHQIPPDRESCHLSTFVTLIGRNWFQRVPFRITSTSEIFHRLMSEILADIDWDDAIIDDVIVWWQSTEEPNMTSVQTVCWTEFRKLGWNSTEPNASSESRALSILATWLVKIGSVLVKNLLKQSAIWFLRQI